MLTPIPHAEEQLGVLFEGLVDLNTQQELSVRLEAVHQSQRPLEIQAGFDRGGVATGPRTVYRSMRIGWAAARR